MRPALHGFRDAVLRPVHRLIRQARRGLHKANILHALLTWPPTTRTSRLGGHCCTGAPTARRLPVKKSEPPRARQKRPTPQTHSPRPMPSCSVWTVNGGAPTCVPFARVSIRWHSFGRR